MGLPEDFITSVRLLLGSETDLFLSSLADEPPVSIRLNPFKAGRNPMKAAVPLRKVPWSQWGYFLEKRPAFTFDPLFHAGYYYVQEASSMFVEYLVGELVKESALCLDLCAAPGGKSLSLLSALPEGSLLVCNEPVRQRAQVLSETMAKSGLTNVMVTHNKANDFSAFPHLFDLVLVDAPCSGEGMFRKDETAVKEWSSRNVEMCAARQKDILKEVWPALKPGGLLIYSTCTFNTAENEENTLWAAEELGAEFLRTEIKEEWGITLSSGQYVPDSYLFPDKSPEIQRTGHSVQSELSGYRFFPHKTKGEGLFVTLLRKTGTMANEALSGTGKKRMRAQEKNGKERLSFVKESSFYADMLLQPGAFDFMESGNRIIALPVAHSETILALNERLHTLSMGVELGERKRQNFIPSHRLAMSMALNPKAFPCCEVAFEEAVSYLRREAITLQDAPKGYLIPTYKGEPLGFVKNIGNRANNLYPNEWRIRSGYLPEKRMEIFHL